MIEMSSLGPFPVFGLTGLGSYSGLLSGGEQRAAFC